MKAVKSYLCFTPFFYRVLVLAAAPIVLCGFNCWLMLDYVMPLYLFLALFVLLEVFGDYWTFGGICAKGICGSEYMKSSAKGRRMLRQALLVDCIRKLIWLILFAAANCMACYFVTKKPLGSKEIWLLAGMILSAYVAILAGNVIGRYMQHYAFQILIAYLASALYVALTLVLLKSRLLLILLGLVAGVGMTVLNVWNVMRKMEGSYYDEAA